MFNLSRVFKSDYEGKGELGKKKTKERGKKSKVLVALSRFFFFLAFLLFFLLLFFVFDHSIGAIGELIQRSSDPRATLLTQMSYVIIGGLFQIHYEPFF